MNGNLLGAAVQALGGNFAQRAAQYLCETEGSTQIALNGLLPALLGTVANKGSTTQGASALLDMMRAPGLDGGWLGSIGALLEPGSRKADPVMNAGTGILNTLLGDKLGAIGPAVAGYTGLGAGNATSLLKLLAPLVMSLLSRQVTDGKLNADGLQSLLKGQQASLAAAQEPRLAGLFGLGGTAASVTAATAVTATATAASTTMGAATTAAATAAAATAAVTAHVPTVPGVTTGGGASHTIPAAAAMSAAAGAPAAAIESGSGLLRWLPWLFGAIVLFWLFRGCTGPMTQKSVDAPVAGATATAGSGGSTGTAGSPASTAATGTGAGSGAPGAGAAGAVAGGAAAGGAAAGVAPAAASAATTAAATTAAGTAASASSSSSGNAGAGSTSGAPAASGSTAPNASAAGTAASATPGASAPAAQAGATPAAAAAAGATPAGATPAGATPAGATPAGATAAGATPAGAAPAAAAATTSPATSSSTSASALPPVVKLYFETAKSAPPTEVGSSLKPIVEYAKANASAKVQISGFHDKTGDAARNVQLAKDRAMGIRAQILQDGIADGRIIMEKPAVTTGGGDDREARRVEVSIVQ